MNAPIVLFCYNRPQHTLNVLTSLSEAVLSKQSALYIYCDGLKPGASEEQERRVNAVREIARSRQWCNEVHIICRDRNYGLSESVIDGVTDIINRYGKVIVLEDDLVVSQNFLRYMNSALDIYEDVDDVFQISGYTFPIAELSERCEAYFLGHISSWGWATWKKAWDCFDKNAKGYESLRTNIELRNKFDFDGTRNFSAMMLDQMEKRVIDSWAIRWKWSVFIREGVTLYPAKTFVLHEGTGDDATHVKRMIMDSSVLDEEFMVTSFPAETRPDTEIVAIITEYFRTVFRQKPAKASEKKKTFWQKVISLVNR